MLSVADSAVTENDSAAALAFTVRLDRAATETVTVHYATAADSAEPPGDYTHAEGELSFAPGTTVAEVLVPIVDDAVYEGDEAMTLVLSEALNAQLGRGVAAGQILEDDAPPTLSVADVSLPEGAAGGSRLIFRLTLSEASAVEASVDYSTQESGATEGDDYSAVQGVAQFPAGTTAASVAVNVHDDSLDENDEALSLSLASPSGLVLASNSAAGMIVDDDAPPTIAIADAESVEGSDSIEFAVSLSSVSGKLVSVDYASADASAVSGIDYTSVAGKLEIEPGETAGSVTVPLIADAAFEGEEAFLVSLGGPVNASLGQATGTGTIVDDDPPPSDPPASIAIADVFVTEGDSGSSLAGFSLSLSAAEPADVSVDFTTIEGTALAGSDFVTAAGTLIFPAGITSRAVDIEILGDVVDEPDETFRLGLGNVTGDAVLADASARATIEDDDGLPGLFISDAAADEGDSGNPVLNLAVGLSSASAKSVTVAFATADGTATAGVDYSAVSGTLTFDPGVTSRTIAVLLIPDELDEGDETFGLSLASPSNAEISAGTATATIRDDDAQIPWGLDSRPENLTCVAPERPVVDAEIALTDPFPDLPAFALPVAMAQPPGDDTVWFIAEQGGRVLTFADDPAASTASVAIDISGQVQDSPGNELGLLGIAFHPEYSDGGSPHAGELFLSYTAAGPTSRVSRFTTANDWTSWTEEVILEVNQDNSNHNGGNIAFGPDGFLYTGFGDGGDAGDPHDRAEDTRNLLGAMLRIDVDGEAPYTIPADNPFAGNPVCPADHSSAQDCPEIYAWGLRNPWRWSFDSATGELWLGDVGQDSWEEVNRIELGGNYGWDTREGAHCHEPSAGCETLGLIDPVTEYDQSLGQSVIGGFVYRGADVPDLVGRFLFADAYSGRIWMLEDDGQGGYSRIELLDVSAFFSSFAQGNDGELFLLDLADGSVVGIAEGTGSGATDTIPALLSDSGCVDPGDPTQPASGLIPYTINAPFWSDDAEKERFLAIPDSTSITVGADDDWELPPGSIVVKNFRLNGDLFETRLLMRHPDGVWGGYTYEWDDAGTDATRVIGGKTKLIDGQEWVYPSEGQCDSCHTQAAGFALGPESAQLNGDLTYPSTGRTANQLVTLDHILLFSGSLPDVPDGQPGLADPADTSAPLTDRARAYLHTNCAQCHRPQGPTPSDMDLRYQTALDTTNTCDVAPLLGNLGIADARLVAPGDPARSVLLERMSRRDVHGMPPLASNLVDTDGAALIGAWVDGLAGCN